jgi:hypothetical protein
VQIEVLIEMAAMRLQLAGMLQSKYTVLACLEGIKCASAPLRRLGLRAVRGSD